MKIDFKTQITFTQSPHLSTRFYNKCESYWSLGERRAKVIEAKGKTYLFSIEHHPLSKRKKFKAIALRVALGATGIIPLITLIGKIHLRRTHHFEEQAKTTTQLSQDQKSIKDPPAFQTPLPEKSPLPFKVLQLPKTREEFFILIKEKGTTFTELNLNKYHDITDDELKEIVTCCPNLTVFIIHEQLITNIDAIRSLRYLEFIKIEECQYLIQGPDFSKMAGLKIIDFTLCKYMTSPPKVEGCTELNDFRISNAPIQSSIDLSGLTKLHKVQICYVDADLPLILKGCISLEELKLENCGQMTELPNLSGLCSLKQLVIKVCHVLEKIPSLSDCENLEEIEVNGCDSLKDEIDLSEKTKLEKVEISHCESLNLFPKLDGCKNLKTFSIKSCPVVNGTLNLSNLTQLDNVAIVKCAELDKVPIFKYSYFLATIRIEECYKLTGIIDFSDLSYLKKLKIESCRELTGAPILLNCSSLEEINFNWIGLNEKLDLSSQGKLKKIKLSNLTEFNEPLDFTKCNELEYVILQELPHLGKQVYFNDLTKLQGVYIDKLKAHGLSINLAGCSDLKAVHCNESPSNIINSSELPKNCQLFITSSFSFMSFPPNEFRLSNLH